VRKDGRPRPGRPVPSRLNGKNELKHKKAWRGKRGGRGEKCSTTLGFLSSGTPPTRSEKNCEPGDEGSRNAEVTQEKPQTGCGTHCPEIRNDPREKRVNIGWSEAEMNPGGREPPVESGPEGITMKKLFKGTNPGGAPRTSLPCTAHEDIGRRGLPKRSLAAKQREVGKGASCKRLSQTSCGAQRTLPPEAACG